MASLTLGLTGPIAAGKSTVARLLAQRGLMVTDADRLVAELYAAGQPGAEVVARLFGPAFLATDGSVDRARLALRVFSDAAARSALEREIHPLVRRRFAELARAAEGPAVLEATLLVEAGYGPDFDLIVTVEAPEEVRLGRAIERGLSEEEARARILAQGDGQARRAAAHRVIENDGTAEDLARKVDALVAEITQTP